MLMIKIKLGDGRMKQQIKMERIQKLWSEMEHFQSWHQQVPPHSPSLLWGCGTSERVDSMHRTDATGTTAPGVFPHHTSNTQKKSGARQGIANTPTAPPPTPHRRHVNRRP